MDMLFKFRAEKQIVDKIMESRLKMEHDLCI